MRNNFLSFSILLLVGWPELEADWSSVLTSDPLLSSSANSDIAITTKSTYKLHNVYGLQNNTMRTPTWLHDTGGVLDLLISSSIDLSSKCHIKWETCHSYAQQPRCPWNQTEYLFFISAHATHVRVWFDIAHNWPRPFYMYTFHRSLHLRNTFNRTKEVKVALLTRDNLILQTTIRESFKQVRSLFFTTNNEHNGDTLNANPSQNEGRSVVNIRFWLTLYTKHPMAWMYFVSTKKVQNCYCSFKMS